MIYVRLVEGCTRRIRENQMEKHMQNDMGSGVCEDI